MQRQPQATATSLLAIEQRRRLPVGAEIIDGRIEFRVWAPGRDRVELVMEQPDHRIIDAAHGLGIGVILDVVYNHFGPDGNYLKAFSPSYFTDRYECEWGDAVNFDGPDAGPVREFFIANSAWGTRLIQMVAPGRYRAAMTLLLLGPWTPLIFQGQEYGASTPFLYFADHKPEIAEFIAQGRREFLNQLPSIADGLMESLAEPGREETFIRSRLAPRECRESFRFMTFFKDLVRLRSCDEVFSLYGKGRIEGAVLSDRAFALRFFGHGRDRLLIVNFGCDLHLASIPEPLLAPPREQDWDLIFSTEDPRYEGCGVARVRLDDGWRIPAESATVMASISQDRAS